LSTNYLCLKDCGIACPNKDADDLDPTVELSCYAHYCCERSEVKMSVLGIFPPFHATGDGEGRKYARSSARFIKRRNGDGRMLYRIL
jgi:hypothetical protein